jgi:hypothetical protein
MIMGLITTGIVSLILLGVNREFHHGFLMIWLRSWLIAYGVVVLVVLLLSPWVQHLANYLCRVAFGQAGAIQPKELELSAARCPCSPTDPAGGLKAGPANGDHVVSCRW